MLEGSHSLNRPDTPATSILRELAHTQHHCNRSLSTLYTDIIGFMGEDSVQRVMAYEDNTVDRQRTIDALSHYREYSRDVFVRTLDPQQRIYYHLIHNPTNILLSLTGGGTATLGRWMYKQHRAIHSSSFT